jgi:signal transduction histidine kinase
LVLAALLAPTVAATWLSHEGGAAETMAAARTVLVACGALLSAGLLLAHARLAGNDHSLWLGTSLGVFAVVGLVRGGYSLTHPVSVHTQATTVLGATVALVSVLGTVIVLAAHHPRWMHPLAVGILLAVGGLVAQHVALVDGPQVSGSSVPVVSVVLCAVVVVLAHAVHRLDALPRWARDRLGVAVLLCGLSAVVLFGSVPTDGVLRALVSLAGGAAGMLLITTTSAALLREVVTERSRQLADLQRQLASAEEHRRADSARLHDVNSLVAGIASASHLIRALPPSPHRVGLEAMLVSEIDRLQRLLADRGRGSGAARVRREIDVDEVCGHLALSHSARGRVVTWSPSGARVAANADDLAQLLDILLENAARHGSPDHIDLTVDRSGAQVVIGVSDHGPGVAPELRGSLFEWGARGRDSTGTGIGLHTARCLAARLGGTLLLEDSALGARFTLRLPRRVRTTNVVPEDPTLAAL